MRTGSTTPPTSYIERVQNKYLFQQYSIKKREIDKRNPGQNNERLLYHGTDFEAIKEINKFGFNRSYCGKNDLDGLHRLCLARVLVGKSIETSKEVKYLPKRPDCDALYDSGKNSSESIYVIFNDIQAYPEYMLTFSLPKKM
ncbi:protein mono-ADP-ribosyltransferase PARP15-like [Physella acuta]|uniref:protein mono-ADP-ribosyltransferase PARP15-like n=1 Tax=Physella acuta TaxID=109671 RepID=UPI0027DB2DD8|nr:protein mono-ADP-ribosyltransferase PARP15-like [Physella acuta]